MGLWSRAVDFVSEEDLCEDWTSLELEGSFAGVGILGDNVGPDDIGGHQVWGELDAVEGERQGLGECSDEEGFSEPGDAFEEDIAASEEAHEYGVDDLLLPDHNFADFGAEVGEGFAECFAFCLYFLRCIE